MKLTEILREMNPFATNDKIDHVATHVERLEHVILSLAGHDDESAKAAVSAIAAEHGIVLPDDGPKSSP